MRCHIVEAKGKVSMGRNEVAMPPGGIPERIYPQKGHAVAHPQELQDSLSL